jgi:uncharacterized protein YbjT (DUF2867 family)
MYLSKSKYKNSFVPELNNIKKMNYVITGSLGHISKPIAQQLIEAGHNVTVITSNPAKAKEIEALGAKAATGSVEDVGFLTQAFKGADAAYLMIPPNFAVTHWLDYMKSIARNYAEAVKANHIQYVVALSSIGAHMRNGAGPVDGTAYLETVLEQIPGLNAKFLRPSYFFYNLFQQAGMIKHSGIMGSTQPASHKLVLTHTDDIAAVAAEELLNLNFKGHSVRYIASDERTWEDITNVLTSAVGKQGTPFIEFTDDQSLQGMLQAGLSNTIAEGYTIMGKALRSKEMEADYWNNRPAKLGKVKLEDFAKEFAAVYNAQ